MADHDLPGIPATAKVSGHPIHPMLIPFPIAPLVATFVYDVIFWRMGNAFWAQTAFWSLTAAVVMAVIAALAGLPDFPGSDRIPALGDAWRHMFGNLLAVILAGLNLWLRY